MVKGMLCFWRMAPRVRPPAPPPTIAILGADMMVMGCGERFVMIAGEI